jgi:DNA helicase II / ATP-dependent DNA helicase PcrA
MQENEGQRRAFEYDDSCVVTACPGSGKTATLALKVMRLLSSIQEPRGLACLTFNNEAVREFRKRLDSFGLQLRQNVVLGTVHSFCLGSVIRPFGKIFLDDLPNPYRVANDDEIVASLAKALDSVGVNRPPKEYRSTMNEYRRTHLDRKSADWLRNEETVRVIEAYEANLRRLGLIDFDDQVLLALKLIEENQYVRDCLAAKFPWIAIDEYQDLGLPLHKIVKTLLNDGRIKIFAVGDPDQSIYGFLGASPDYLTQLAEETGIESIPLSLNYRCGQRIIDGAEIVLSSPDQRSPMSSRGERDPGEIFFVEKRSGFSGQLEAITSDILPQILETGVEPHNIGILYIDKGDGHKLAEHLSAEEIEFRGERDQRYQRSPITRLIEDKAHWCVGGRARLETKFRDLATTWESYLRQAGHLIEGHEIVALRAKLFEHLGSARNGDQPLAEWLENLDGKIEIRNTIRKLHKSPYELEAFESLMAAASEGRMSDYTLNDFAGCGAKSNRITLTTLHSSKGLQFDVVIIPGLEQGRLPWNNLAADRLRESRRTFYVGLTRARYKVFLMYSGYYYWGTRRVQDGPSRFLVELQQRLET